MDQGRFEEALSAYRDAFAVEPSPALLYNMGRAQEKLGRYAAALTTLEAFAAAAPADLKAKVPRLEALMKDLRARVAQLTIRANVAGARVYLANEPVGTAPFASPVFVMPGTTELQVRAEGHALYAREVTLDAGSNVVFDVALTPAGGANAAASAEPSSGPVTKKWWFWTGVALVVAGGAAVAIAVLTPPSAPQGDIQPGQVTAPLLRF